MPHHGKSPHAPARHVRNRFLDLLQIGVRRLLLVQLGQPPMEVLVEALRQGDVDLSVAVKAPDGLPVFPTDDLAL